MLITYANSMGKNLKELEQVLDKHFSRELGGVHILPFFPSSGDRGFAVINYDIVDPAFGTWEDIRRLSENTSWRPILCLTMCPSAATSFRII